MSAAVSQLFFSFLFIYRGLFGSFILSVCMLMCAHAHMAKRVCKSPVTTCGSRFSLSTMWVLELNSGHLSQ